MLTRRLLVAAGLSALLVALAVVGGWPDPGKSLDLLTDSGATAVDAATLIVLLCWLGVALAALVSAVAALSPLRHHRVSPARRRSLAVLAIGIAILGVGIVRHQGGYRVCCANAATTQQVERVVR